MRHLVRWLVAGGASGLMLLGLAALVYFGDAHRGYRTLAPDVYHPTFFPRHAEARAQGAAWVRTAAAVAREYVGLSRLCPDQVWRELNASAGRAVIVVERQCPYSAYSAATVQEFRVELERPAEAWEVRWAGLRLKCGLNRHPLAVYLLRHNPFRRAPAAWSAPLAATVDGLARQLNPWMTECL